MALTSRSLPHFITAIRLVAGILFLCFGNVPSSWIVSWALALAAVTDLIDGRLARYLGATSQSGAIFDTISDKGFVLALLMRATMAGVLPTWLLATWTLQHLVLLTGRRVLFKRKWLHQLRPGPIGMLSGFLAYWTAVVSVSPLGSPIALWFGVFTILMTTIHVILALFRFQPSTTA